MSWIKDIKYNCTKIREISDRLLSLSASFYKTGNTIISKELEINADVLAFALDRIDKVITTKTNEDSKQSVQNSINVLNAPITGGKLNDKNQKK